MDGRKFLSGLNRYLWRKSSDSRSNKSSLTSRSQRSSKSSRLEAIGDIAQTPQFNRNEFDRLISEQGLQTPRSASSHGKRQVRDKSFYMGLLHRKGYEIRSEIQKLLRECKRMSNDQSVYVACKATAESSVLELQRLHEVLRDFNCLDDLLNRSITIVEAEEEYGRLKSDNAIAAAEVEEIFQCVKSKSSLIGELETDITQEDHVFDILESTPNTDREKLDLELKRTLAKQDQEVLNLLMVKENLEALCKRLGAGEAVSLLRELSEQAKKRDMLMSEQQGSLEKRDLQKRKKYHSDLLDCIRRQIRNTRSQIDKTMDEITEATNNEHLSKRACKVSKLKNQERMMDIFVDSYPSQKMYLLEECKDHQREALSLLIKMSDKLSFGIPTMSRVTNSDKSDEQLLRESLKKELLNLLRKEALEDKFLEEFQNLKQELQEKRKEIEVYSDIDNLKASAEIKMRSLTSELLRLKKQLQCHRLVLKDHEQRYFALKEKLHESPVRNELSVLEKRWHALEGERFALEESIAEAKLKGDYSVLKGNVMGKLRTLNEELLSSQSESG